MNVLQGLVDPELLIALLADKEACGCGGHGVVDGCNGMVKLRSKARRKSVKEAGRLTGWQAEIM